MSDEECIERNQQKHKVYYELKYLIEYGKIAIPSSDLLFEFGKDK
jgi:hypothetical protein